MRLHFMIVAILLASFALHGQETPRLEQRLEQLKTNLQLTDQQTEQVEQILQKTAQEARQLREENRKKQQEMRAAHLRLMDQTESQIEKILTPEQKEKFDLYKKNRMGTRRLMRLQERLNLDADQTYKIGQILSESKDKIMALREKKQSREARYKEILAIRDEADKKISGLLNEEQKAEYEALKQRLWAKGPKPGSKHGKMHHKKEQWHHPRHRF